MNQELLETNYIHPFDLASKSDLQTDTKVTVGDSDPAKSSWEPATEISVFKHWQMEMVSAALAFFNWDLKGMTRSNGWKLKPERFKLEIRYKFLTVKSN